MDQLKDKNQQLSIVVDRKHGTTYCITNGRGYIRTSITPKGDKK